MNEKIEYYKDLAPPSDKVLKARLYGEEEDMESPSPTENKKGKKGKEGKQARKKKFQINLLDEEGEFPSM